MSNKLHFKIDRDFTVVPNIILKDKRLSWKAKGIFMQILSLPEGWDFSVAGLSQLVQDGEKATNAGIHELVEAGYLEWIKGRTATNQFCVEVNVKLPDPLPVSPDGKIASGQKAMWRNADNKEYKNKELISNKELKENFDLKKMFTAVGSGEIGVLLNPSTADYFQFVGDDSKNEVRIKP